MEWGIVAKQSRQRKGKVKVREGVEVGVHL